MYQKLDILNVYLWVKYSMTEENRETFMKKTCNNKLNPMHFPFDHATGDHWKQIRRCLYVLQNYRFQFEIVAGGKWTNI